MGCGLTLAWIAVGLESGTGGEQDSCSGVREAIYTGSLDKIGAQDTVTGLVRSPADVRLVAS